jgi:hypothetical protein
MLAVFGVLDTSDSVDLDAVLARARRRATIRDNVGRLPIHFALSCAPPCFNTVCLLLALVPDRDVVDGVGTWCVSPLN